MQGWGMPKQPAGSTSGVGNQANFERYSAHFADDGGVHVDGSAHPRRMFDLTEAFARRGYADETIRLILGSNALRVFRELWA